MGRDKIIDQLETLSVDLPGCAEDLESLKTATEDIVDEHDDAISLDHYRRVRQLAWEIGKIADRAAELAWAADELVDIIDEAE